MGQGLGETVPASEFYGLTAEDADGSPFSFSKFKGARAVVVTNVASQCGYTQSNYADFAKLSSSEGLHVVAFPCNQFGQQEPGSDAEIKAFAEGYGLKVNVPGSNFHMMAKADVNGGNTHPVYKFLKQHGGNPKITWNFSTKFVVACDDGKDTCEISSSGDVPSRALSKAGFAHLVSGKHGRAEEM